MVRRRLTLVAVCLLASSAAPALAATPEGLWLTEDRGGIIRIEPCGTALCGRIVGMTEFMPDGTTPNSRTVTAECRMVG